MTVHTGSNGGAGLSWRGVRGRRAGVLMKLVLVYLCLWQVGSVLTCGDNPLRRFRPLSRMLGKDISTLLEVLRTSNPSLYLQIEEEWRIYALCVRQVDTGYFKRSEPQNPHSKRQLGRSFEGEEEGPEGWSTLRRRQRAAEEQQEEKKKEEKEEKESKTQGGTMLIGLMARALAESPDV